MKWITRSHVHVDRVACPWLIQRFIDSEAEFLFVAPSHVQTVADAEEAIPYDIPGADLGHHDDRCSFDAIIERYGLKDRALLKLAEIVRAADTDALEAHPCAAGLEAIATGFGLRFPDDEANLAHQFPVYDALYAWCKLQVAAEGHV